jgi:hypothetical protein
MLRNALAFTGDSPVKSNTHSLPHTNWHLSYCKPKNVPVGLILECSPALWIIEEPTIHISLLMPENKINVTYSTVAEVMILVLFHVENYFFTLSFLSLFFQVCYLVHLLYGQVSYLEWNGNVPVGLIFECSPALRIIEEPTTHISLLMPENKI